MFPLAYESRDWEHGVYLASTMGYEATVAADNQADIRRDPMAMLPFCGYHIAECWRHWLAMKDKLAHPPRIYRVNWFRKDRDGRCMWPGFGQNMRVLQWISERARGEVDAEESVLGYLPRYDDINWQGPDYRREDFHQLMSLDLPQRVAECEDQLSYYADIGSAVPAVLVQQVRRMLDIIREAA